MDQPSLRVLYASQTGCSEAIARGICGEARAQGYGDAAVNPVSDEGKGFELAAQSLAVFVVSSTGQGDPPEHSVAFMRKLRSQNRSSPRWLSGLRFAILGLGDSNYDDFQGNPKQLSRLLLAAGASEVYPRGEADDALGLEDFVEPWKAGLWPVLSPILRPAALETPLGSSSSPPVPEAPLESASSSPAPSSSSTSKPPVFKISNSPRIPPCVIALLPVSSSDLSSESDLISSPEPSSCASLVSHSSAGPADRRVLRLQLALDTPLPADCLPGDAVAIFCPTPPQLVDLLLARLGVSNPDQLYRVLSTTGAAADVPSHLQRPLTLRQAFSRVLDVCQAPRKVLLQMLSQHAHSPDEKQRLELLASHKGAAEYSSFMALHQPCLLTVLRLFPSARPPVHSLLALLPPLSPRHYSLASSPLSSPSRISLAVAISSLAPHSDGTPRAGVGSQFFLDMGSKSESGGADGDVQQRISLHLRPSTRFRFSPSHLTSPVLFVATGTGIAPFLSFFEHRRHLQQQRPDLVMADWWLVFGYRHHWCHNALQEFLSAGVLSKITDACSLEGPSQSYVQHQVEAHGDRVRGLLTEQGGSCLVCGSPAMAKSLAATLRQVLGAEQATGQELFGQLVASDRYLTDVW